MLVRIMHVSFAFIHVKLVNRVKVIYADLAKIHIGLIAKDHVCLVLMNNVKLVMTIAAIVVNISNI